MSDNDKKMFKFDVVGEVPATQSKAKAPDLIGIADDADGVINPDAQMEKDSVVVALSSAPSKIDTREMYINIEHAMTEEIRAVLDEVKDRVSRTNWELGDVSLELYSLVTANDLPYTKKNVFAFVANYIDSEDHGASTIEDYAYVCAGFEPKDRRNYGELPFSHFRFALSYGEQRLLVLEQSMRALEKYGRPVSVRRLRGILEGKEQPPFSTSTYDADAPIIIKSRNSTGLPPEPSSDAAIRGEVESMQDIYVELNQMMKRLAVIVAMMPAKSRKLKQNVAVISTVIKEILLEIGAYRR